MQQQVHPASIGAEAIKSSSFPERKNSRFSVVVYWKDGEAAKELPPRRKGALRVVCISDTHTKTAQFATAEHLKLPEADLLIHAGDFTSTCTNSQVKDFASFLSWVKIPSVVIAGNHDISFHRSYYLERGAKRFHNQHEQEGDPKLLLPKTCTYLEDSQTKTSNGALIWGSPWQPEFCDWAFNLPRAGEEIRAKWKLIPAATDILVTHGPPRGGVGGICRDGFDAGCEVLTERIKEVKPLVHICGHIHECYGVFALGDTLVINASSVNLSYRPTNPPIVFDIVKL